MTEQQFKSISQWQQQTFGKATALSKVAHLKQEIKELNDELHSNDDNPTKTLMEFADCFILLFGAAASYGMSYDDIKDCINAKMHINKQRTWGEPGKNGVVNHIKK